MKVVDPKNLNELGAYLGKKCHIEFGTIGLPSSECEGLFTKIEFDTRNCSIRIVIDIDGTSIAVPVRFISSMSVEE